MSHLRSLALRLRALLDRPGVERELDDELRFHIEREIVERERRGMSPEEARRTTLRDFGGVERFKEDCRDERGTRPLEDLAQDVRYGARALRRRPGFTAVVIVTLALGIGANTAIFSVVNGVLLRPLPFENPDRLIRVRPLADGQLSAASALDYIDMRDANRSFEALAAFEGSSANLVGTGDPERVIAARVSANLFSLVRIRPTLGRGLAPGDDSPDAPPVVVLSDALWRTRFGGDPGIVGRVVRIDDEPRTVVGVAPPNGTYPVGSDLWIPMVFNEDEMRPSNRGSRSLSVIGRLRDGVTLERAQEEMNTIERRLAAQYPEFYADRGIRLQPLHDVLVGDLRTPLLILLGAVGLVLLIACANVANLFLVRGTARGAEMAVRTALGAGRSRLVRQLVTESVLLSTLGGIAGLLLAIWMTSALGRLGAEILPRLGEARVDVTVLLFAAGITLGTGVLFGLLPARHAWPRDLSRALRAGARGARASRGSQRTRNAIVVAEVSLAVLLLVGAGLLMRSFQRLLDVDPGFRPDQVVALEVSLPEARYESQQSYRDFYGALDERLRSIPGVQSAAFISRSPVTESDFSIAFAIVGRAPARPGEELETEVRPVTPDYFRTMGIPLVRGRGIEPRDRADAPRVVVVNAAFVRRYFPDEEALGKYVQLGWSRDSVVQGGTIVGIVGDVRQFSIAREAIPELYLPFAQTPVGRMTSVIRTTADPAVIQAAVRAQVRAIDANLPVFGLATMEEKISDSLSAPRFYTLLVGIFAGVALLLSAVGLYGVIAFAVAQRTHEIGIRIALGATRERVLRAVVGEGLTLAVVGIGLGVAASVAATRILATLLYGVSPTDPLTFLAVGLVLVAVAALACFIPARRAARVDPLIAMRVE